MTGQIAGAQPEKILKELGQVWTSLASGEREHGQPSVLRACAMTLIVVTDEEDEDGSTISQTLVELMHIHPSRAIVLRVANDAEDGLSASVLAQCWKPFGKAQQICCEQIEISAAPERWPDAAPLVLGILVPDLPVVVWCRQKQALRPNGDPKRLAGLSAIFGLAQKLIVDTRDVPLEQAFRVMRGWKANGLVVADLEWTRLTPWRESIAHLFDDPSVLAERAAIHTIEIAYADATPPPAALYLAAWLETGLTARASLVRETGFGTGLQRVTLKFDGEPVELKRRSESCLGMLIRGREQRVSLTGLAPHELMQEELTVLGADEIFDAAFERAAALIAL